MPQAESIATRVSQTPQSQVPSEVDLGALNRDIEGLIIAARSEFANNPLNTSVQQRLKALLDLQSILHRQALTQDQLRLVRGQVSALAPSTNPLPPVPQAATPAIPVLSTPTVPTPPTQAALPAYQQLLNPGTLAELIKVTAGRQQQQPTPPPQMSALVSQIAQASSTPQPAVAAPAENPLIAALRARGLLSAVPAPLPAPAAAPTPDLTSAFPFIVPGQVRQTAPVAIPQNPLNVASTTNSSIHVQMSTASIKM